MYTRNEYLVELYKSYWKNEVVDFDKISQEEKDLAQEIVMNSRIAVRKQNLFKISLGITEKIAHAKKTKWVTEGLSDYEIKIIVESAKKSAQDSKSKFSIEKRDIDSKRC